MTDKEAYEAAVKLVEARRCITCEHYQTSGKGAGCALYQCELPLDCLYTPQECEGYAIQIPF